MDHQNMLDSIGTKLEKFLSTKTVVGDPIVVGDVTLVPIQNAAFGFGSGGGEGKTDKDSGVGGGAGGGATLRPVAIIAVVGTDVRVFSMGKKGALEGLVEMIPEALSKIKLGKCKDDGESESVDEAECCEESK